MDIPEEKFKRIKAGAEDFYKNIDKIKCPYLDDEVHFNVKGLDHIKFKRFGRPRTPTD